MAAGGSTWDGMTSSLAKVGTFFANLRFSSGKRCTIPQLVVSKFKVARRASSPFSVLSGFLYSVIDVFVLLLEFGSSDPRACKHIQFGQKLLNLRRSGRSFAL